MFGAIRQATAQLNQKGSSSGTDIAAWAKLKQGNSIPKNLIFKVRSSIFRFPKLYFQKFDFQKFNFQKFDFKNLIFIKSIFKISAQPARIHEDPFLPYPCTFMPYRYQYTLYVYMYNDINTYTYIYIYV